MRRSGPTVGVLFSLCQIFFKVMFIYYKEKGMRMLWCYRTIKMLRNLHQTTRMNASTFIGHARSYFRCITYIRLVGWPMMLHSSEQNIQIFYSKWQFRLIIIYLSKTHMPNLTVMHIKLHGQEDGHTTYGHCLHFWNMFVIQTYSYHLNISLKCRFLRLNWF